MKKVEGRRARTDAERAETVAMPCERGDDDDVEAGVQRELGRKEARD